MVAAYFRRAYSSFAAHVLDIPPRLLALMLFLLFLSFPITRPPTSILLTLTTTNILAIYAASWDLLVGRTGQISLGHALFFGIGTYGTGLLSYHLGWPPWVTIPLSLLIGVLTALLIGFPCLRVKGHYLALVTMAFPLILIGLILYFKNITRGDAGIWGLPNFFPFLPYDQQFLADYYFTLLLLFVSAIILYKIANSKTGIVMVSILDDEVASKASGISVTKYKLMAFVISGLFATLAGSVNAHLSHLRVANLASLTVTLSFMVVVWTIFGGIGTIYGSIVGVYILQMLDQYALREIVDIPTPWHYIIFSVIVIIFVIKWPRGLARSVVEDGFDELAKEREIEERGKRIWKKYKKKVEK